MDESEQRRDDQERTERYVRQMIETVQTFAGKGALFAAKLLVAVTVICVGGFALGVAALSDGIESVWIVLGVTFGAIAIGCAGLALWRAMSVRRRAPGLADEVRSLVKSDPDTTVVETFVVDDSADGGRGSAIVLSRQVGGFREAYGTRLADTPELNGALRSITSFPILVVLAIPITAVFAFMGGIFLLALAL